MNIETFYDKRTFTLTYVVYDPHSKDAVVIDPVLDYDSSASTTSTESVDRVIRFVEDNNLIVHYILETHAHADHLSGSQVLKQRFPEARLAIGARITEVQDTFKRIFDLPGDFPTDGRQFDQLFDDGAIVTAGTLTGEVLYTPGHTPACASFKFGDAVFTGDALFMPDFGTGRCDFPAGSARAMYHSVKNRLYELPDDTRVFVGHDYQPGGREVRFESTIGEEKRTNVQLNSRTGEEEFVRARNERDKTLAAPKLLFQSVQVNIDGGSLPRPASNQVQYLKIPVNVFRPEAALSGDAELEVRGV